jgi:hypothetical protein
MSVTAQGYFDFSEFRSHSITAGVPPYLEFPFVRLTAYKREPEKCKCLRFAKSFLLSSFRSKAAKLNQSGLVRMKR